MTPLTGLGALLPEALWRKLLTLGPRSEREPGRILMRQGDPGDVVMALTRGRVRVMQQVVDGLDQLVAVRRRGEVLGDIAVYGECRRTATVVTVDPCVVHTLRGTEFLRFVHDHGLAPLLMQHNYERLQEAERHRAEIALLQPSHVLCKMLLRLAEPTGDGSAVVDLGLSQNDLALMIGAHRNTVGKALNKLKELGVVARDPHRRMIVINDVRALDHYARNGLEHDSMV